MPFGKTRSQASPLIGSLAFLVPELNQLNLNLTDEGDNCSPIRGGVGWDVPSPSYERQLDHLNQFF